MTSLDDLRAKAAAHQAHLDRNTKMYTVKELAARWHVSTNTVRAIAHSVLPYINVGTGLVRESRRFHPDDVEIDWLPGSVLNAGGHR